VCFWHTTTQKSWGYKWGSLPTNGESVPINSGDIMGHIMKCIDIDIDIDIEKKIKICITCIDIDIEKKIKICITCIDIDIDIEIKICIHI